ncbi:hypothetical protein LTR50_001996 [Elasticomyces elasticus]|nr:hypothetical protein LTR50_001996 [Elasticomyces elasticus]
MPCFKGLAVSIHTPDGPLPEYSIQKQSRASRITSYIPVPPAKVPADSTTNKPEQSSFAISITLLTPGLNVPYSCPKPTPQDPHPRPQVVGGLPGWGGERGHYGSTAPPYVPRTTSPNETIAAYIYFDGRVKEEVATLLRKGEETWVNSRWVSVPESEGGGLAEREFLFREVGLERWLNGLDLEGKDKAARIERRQQRIEKKRRKRKEMAESDEDDKSGARRVSKNGILRYGENQSVESVGNDESLFSSDSDSEDEPPQPEAAGQIKVALFRVLASGEIKRGEYSPQFDAHDDDEEASGGQNGSSNPADEEDIDHTTSFAKPKTLDPKSISTQTVTGIDSPDRPYAVFTFLYRGEKQLQKMGILSTPDPSSHKAPTSAKRKSIGPDFSKLGPLSTAGTVGFSGYRDSASGKEFRMDDEMADSDEDRDDADRGDTDDFDTKQENGTKMLSPEDAQKQGELADGVRKIKLKRQRSAEPLSTSSNPRKSPHVKASESPSVGTPQSANSVTANAGTPPASASPVLPNEVLDASSPFKRQRASMSGLDNNLLSALGAASVPNDSVPQVLEMTYEVKPAEMKTEAVREVEKEGPDDEL